MEDQRGWDRLIELMDRNIKEAVNDEKKGHGFIDLVINWGNYRLLNAAES